MENKTYAKPMYKCAVCGGVYDSIAERMKCEAACLKRQEEEAAKVAKAKKKEEQKVRNEEVDAAIKNAQDLLTQYTKDYGHYSVTSNNIVDDLYRLLFW